MTSSRRCLKQLGIMSRERHNNGMHPTRNGAAFIFKAAAGG